MIFVTSGTQLPFERFIRAIDEIASAFPAEKFLVQSIDTGYKINSPNIEFASHLSPVAFNEAVTNARLIISHAGVGTIISAAEARKPLIVFPRLGKLKEHRNDHQVATCNGMQQQFPLNVANSVVELKALIGVFYEGRLSLLPNIPRYASADLLSSLKDFIEAGETQLHFGLGR